MNFRCKLRHRRSILRPRFLRRVLIFRDFATFSTGFCISCAKTPPYYNFLFVWLTDLESIGLPKTRWRTFAVEAFIGKGLFRRKIASSTSFPKIPVFAKNGGVNFKLWVWDTQKAHLCAEGRLLTFLRQSGADVFAVGDWQNPEQRTKNNRDRGVRTIAHAQKRNRLYDLHRESKKQDTKLLAITSLTIIRFSNFFHC